MKRLRRWLFNLLAGSSLLLCIAMTALCGRSHWVSEGFGWDSANRDNPGWNFDHPPICHYGILSGHGSLVFARDNLSDNPSSWEILSRSNLSGCVMSIDDPEIEHPDDSRLKKMLSSIGIHFGSFQDGGMPFIEEVLILPDWLLIAFFALLPTWFLLRRKNPKRERERLGLCLNCGYDLRATPDRCPECGNVPSKKRTRGKSRR